jgi:hypothetical protein
MNISINFHQTILVIYIDISYEKFPIILMTFMVFQDTSNFEFSQMFDDFFMQKLEH